jgi:hypothetical protein
LGDWLDAALNGTGFIVCNFPPDEDCCEKCDKPRLKLFGLNDGLYMNVVIDGIEYVPKAEIPELTDERLKACLEVLTSMRYFGETHKMKSHAWDAINALSPELAQLSENAAYDRIHGIDGDV